jgi:Tfp pilus assembly major pilin PilA
MTEKKPKEDLSAYKKWGLTLLQLMGLLAVAGIIGEIIVKYFF